MKIEIKNFQGIKKAELEFPKGNLIAIVGPTNSGKSSIVRALEYAINNAGGTDFINREADTMSVSIEYEGRSVVWNKNRKKPASYIIDGREINKVGSTQLPEVSEALNMSEIDVDGDRVRLNFWKQFDYPFLVGKTPAQLFNFISKSREQEVLTVLQDDTDVTTKEVSKLINSTQAQVDLKTRDIASIESELNNIDLTSIDLEKITKFNTLLNKVNSAREEIEQSEQLLDKINAALVSNIRRADSIKSIMKEIEESIKVVTTYETYLDKTIWCRVYSENLLEKTEVKSTLDNKLKSLESLIESINTCTSKIDLYEAAQNKRIKLFNDIYSIIKQLETEKDNHKKVLEELSKIDICPLCGQDIKNHNHLGGNL